MCFAHFGRRKPNPAGYRSHINRFTETVLARESSDNLTGGHEARDTDTGLFNCLSSALLTVYQRENAGYERSCATHSLDCAQCGTARGYYVLYYCDTVSFSYGPLEQFPCAMSLCLFPHGECAQWVV